MYAGKLAKEVFAAAGFGGPTTEDDWDLLFTHWPMGDDIRRLALPPRPARPGRLHNHCQYFLAAGDKCRLASHLHNVRSAYEEVVVRSGNATRVLAEKPLHLRTFAMQEPDQVKEWASSLLDDPDKVWLVKPCTAGRSEGILLISGRKNLKKVKEVVKTYAVVQEYVDRPYTGFGGKKFHLRLYVLVTRWDPVTAFLYDEGIIFRSRHDYNRKKLSSKRDIFSGISKDVEPLTLASLWEHLGEARSAEVKTRLANTFADIVGPEVAMSYGKADFQAQRNYGCFDLFGADVMLDDSLQPLLLEVNQGPNMWVDGEGEEHEPLLRRVKVPLMEQIAQWAALYVQEPPADAAAAAQLERMALLNFTPVGPATKDGLAVYQQRRLLQEERASAQRSSPAQAVDDGGVADTAAGAAESTEAQDRQLQWRALPYHGESNSIYAGILALEAFAGAGFKGPVGGHDWDLLFTHFAMGKTLQKLALPPRPGRLVNHCEYFHAAGHKCRLSQHLHNTQRARAQAAMEGDSAVAAAGGGHPRHLRSFELKDAEQFSKWLAALRAEPDRLWLAKPCTAGHSQGIQFISGSNMDVAKQLKNTWTVVQEYVERPFLGFGGTKFHLRVYVLVTRWDPIGVLLYDEGLIFRSRHSYNSRQPSDKRDIFSGISQDVEPLPFAALWRELGAERAERVRRGMVDLFADVLGPEVTTTFGNPARLAERGYGCFDLFGADVILDESLEPLLLEVNQGPNMWVDGEGREHEPLLREVKAPLMGQLAHWAALYARSPPRTADAAKAIEEEALLNFTRVL